MNKDEAMEILGELMLSGRIHKASEATLKAQCRLLLHWVSTDQPITEDIANAIKQLEVEVMDFDKVIVWAGMTLGTTTISGDSKGQRIAPQTVAFPTPPITEAAF